MQANTANTRIYATIIEPLGSNTPDEKWTEETLDSVLAMAHFATHHPVKAVQKAAKRFIETLEHVHGIAQIIWNNENFPVI